MAITAIYQRRRVLRSILCRIESSLQQHAIFIRKIRKYVKANKRTMRIGPVIENFSKTTKHIELTIFFLDCIISEYS